MLYAGLGAAAMMGCGEAPADAPPAVEETTPAAAEHPPSAAALDDARLTPAVSLVTQGPAYAPADATRTPPTVEPHVKQHLRDVIDIEPDEELHYRLAPEDAPLWKIGAGPCKDCRLIAQSTRERAGAMRLDAWQPDAVVRRKGAEGTQEAPVRDKAVVCDADGACGLLFEVGPFATVDPSPEVGAVAENWTVHATLAADGRAASHTWSLDIQPMTGERIEPARRPVLELQSHATQRVRAGERPAAAQSRRADPRRPDQSGLSAEGAAR